MLNSFPQPRNVREQILTHDRHRELATAYKTTLRIPLAADVRHLPAKTMIDAILDVEYDADGKFGGRSSSDTGVAIRNARG